MKIEGAVIAREGSQRFLMLLWYIICRLLRQLLAYAGRMTVISLFFYPVLGIDRVPGLS